MVLYDYSYYVLFYWSGMNPKYTTRDQVPQRDIEAAKNEFDIKQDRKELEIECNWLIAYFFFISEDIHKVEREQFNVEKFYRETVLMEQEFALDNDYTVAEYIEEYVKKLGENIKIQDFVKWVCGEGIEKVTQDFGQDVQNIIQSTQS
jgi:translation elongation factor EF-Ts